ncbi:MAG: ABC transporter permease, partial [Dehalococcoidia bacterium]
RRSIVQFLQERARPPERPTVFRYAIDLLVLAAMALFWWQIRGRGGFLTEQLLGDGLEMDSSLLLGPVLALLAAGLVLLRVLPLVLRLLARLVDPVGPIWLVHGLKRVARDHLASGTLAVLLMLATALGVFGAALGSTLSQSQADQARYSVGGEIVTPPPKPDPYRPRLDPGEALAALPGVRDVAPIYRGTVTSAGSSSSSSGHSLLAVDPDILPDVAWFRENFAGKSLNELLRPLRRMTIAEQGPQLPAGTEFIGVWARAERAYTGYNLWLNLRGADGQHKRLQLGNLGVESWNYLEASIPEDLELQEPLTLVALYISGGPYTGYGKGSVALDEVTARVGEESTVIEDFESAGPWSLLPNLGVAKDTITYESEAAHSGNAGGLYVWTASISGSVRGLFVPPAPMPLPAIGSAGFSVGQELVGSVEDQPISLVVQGVTDYFPTLYPSEHPFLIVNREHLDAYMRVLPLFLTKPTKPNEYWIGLHQGTDRTLILGTLHDVTPLYSRIRDREEQAERAASNPLAGGAWGGLALLGAIALGGVAVMGFSLYAVLAVQRSKVELGVLRALGLSRWRVSLVLALEGLIVAFVGIGIGAALGAWVGRWTLGYLGVTAGGRPVVPPMDLLLDGRLAAVTYVEVGLAAVLAMLLAFVLASRLRLHDVLRVEE